MTPEARLVRAYAKEAAPLHRRGDDGPEQLPSGAKILALDDGGRARVVVAAYELLASVRTYGERIMLGLLATPLLRKNLPLGDLDLEAMAIGCSRAVSPAWGPCDYDHALLKALKRAERITPRTKAALAELMKRRGQKY